MRVRLVALAALAAALASVVASATAAPTAATRIFTLRLTGRAETPVGDRSGRGTATITIRRSGSVCWRFRISKIDGAPTAAHIHRGRRGTAGPVVVPLGTAYKARGCTAAKPALARAILAHPASFYVNVHNAKHPAGALRSQL